MRCSKFLLLVIIAAIITAGVFFINNRQAERQPPHQTPPSNNNQQIPTPPPSAPIKFIHTEGQKIRDQNGNEIFLRGFNIGPVKFASYKDGLNTLEQIDAFNDIVLKNYISQWDVINMKNMGANVLRAHSYLRFYTLETGSYQYDEGYLKTLDDLINIAYSKGISVIITMTGAGQNEHQNETNGLGNTLWTDHDLRSRVIAAWKYIAKYYANNPGVAGYDILNEPSPTSEEIFHAFYKDVIDEIRQVDRNHMIILSANYFSEEAVYSCGGEYNDSNVLLQIHQYVDANKNAEENPESVIYPTRELLEQKLQKMYLFWPELQKHPLFIGEFSALWESEEKGLRWTKDMIELMNQYGIHWTYFSYKHIFGQTRGLYGAIEWWQKDVTPEQIDNLEISEGQKLLLQTTENYLINQEVGKILKDGFKFK
ncbi:MAG: hypothetical protein COV55_02345 [Candidatus Komeilibacteria bacterium CG11_big_fil_rev_8_21_14_0_20_36_20]|uniref:Glycoside hydrolase family 5 domain-containing protein n=1 Tax=Candidatus Komeilibacteria bacterium CG11_big_fil_rev_8_21_14_0_20_36_20 TaxID=1974477 RepID=A0A2H0ND18_9BACT|nr:MAG: hypothetical protein COV55_02345 [Candidatus Komeilibacteria bacterium CG11_big_fil_rev_8_21_14_0_20_36_20]PIR81814.1 MAG: hypothetical protein COU21_01405 [Candidatus Komeilibacteria bacterium CG10_big_fil_rev_8_21_14_0_10_36_65]PJC55304.1 MAG: hypothetical protein CO027_02740 [Candidatus Komeilibacteria bacterium CG_4_9_14_0_2_um_filter_36_13]